MKRKIVAISLMTLSCLYAGMFFSFAESRSFKLGQWSDIQNSILQGVARYYVDSLPVDKMMTDGITSMLAALDPYTIYVPESSQEDFQLMIAGSYGGIGAIIHKPDKDGNVIINEPYAGSPAVRAGLQCGDEIVEIDGASTRGLTVSESSAKMKGKPGTDVLFKVKKVRSGLLQDIRIVREKIHLPDVEYYGMLDASTGYIFQTGFTEGVSAEVKNAFLDLRKQGMKRLVLDLRSNGGGLLDEAVKIVSMFVPKGTLVVTSKGTDGEKEYRTASDPIDTSIPIMVLVDSGSASASEIVSGAIQDLDRGVIAGVRTYGKGLVQRVVPIAYNGQLKVTVAKYYTPSGRCVQAKDYAHRNEDGSVGNIPDSLIHEFKTAGGRTVRDGGGITPDMEVKSHPYNRISFAVVYSGITSNYAIEYVRKHESIPEVDSFSLSDADYDDFVAWAENQKFDSRSEAETYYDLMEKQLRKEGVLNAADSTALKQIESLVKMDKRTSLLRAKDQIRPLLEEEIAVRYYYQSAGVKIRIRTDEQLKQAVSQWK